MKIVLLGSAACIHSVRWVNAFAQRGIDAHLVSAHPPTLPLDTAVTCHPLPYRPPHGYLLNLRALRRLLSDLKPDVFNPHYASGYGTLGRLAGYRPTVLSVWGSDVFDFPAKSLLHRRLIEKNLSAADAVGSTSSVMAEQCQSLCKRIKRLVVTPFGVDMKRFSAPPLSAGDQRNLTIGTVKKLHPKYGVDTLMKGFALTREALRKRGEGTDKRLRLRIVGSGPQRPELVGLAHRLSIYQATEFVPAVAHDLVPSELAKLDIYAAISRLDSESFGVAVVEALACQRPAVVSDAGGLPEVVNHGETGLVVPRESPSAVAEALLDLIDHPEKRIAMGVAGRKDVVTRFRWEDNVTHMINFLADVAHAAPLKSAA